MPANRRWVIFAAVVTLPEQQPYGECGVIAGGFVLPVDSDSKQDF
jgi:hypothetical protein